MKINIFTKDGDRTFCQTLKNWDDVLDFIEHTNYEYEVVEEVYHRRPDVVAKRKKYSKEYNARPDVKEARHEWYIQKLIKEVRNEL